MLDQRRAATRPEQRREQLFTERYEGLLAWALRLTHQDRGAAEDLVQDAFVQFMLGRTGLEQIENIDGYLRRMLRYMHASRMSRQAQRLNDAALSVADYDSLSVGWTAMEPARRMQALQELQQICSYACARKESSRAGSVLILRYFHEYLPTEIARIIASSRHCVDQLQALARREVKLFMNQPGRLRFVTKRAAERPVVGSFGSSADLMTDLRRMIFLSCQGECPRPEELREIYSSGNTQALSTPKLAHIISCAGCLDAVNNLLGLAPLSSRYQPPSDGGDGSGGGPGDLQSKLGRHLRTISEHKPNELRIAVNGVDVSALKISSDVTEFDLNLNADEPVEFIEITSEQGVQLLFFSSGTGSESEQWAWVELSEGRTLAAFLRFQDGPSLRVVYKDPTTAVLSVNQEILIPGGLSSPLSLVPAAGETPALKVATWRYANLLQSWAKRALGFLKRADGSASAVDPRADLAAERGASRSLFSGHLATHDRRRLWTQPGFVTVLLVAVSVASFLVWRSSVETTPNAFALLAQAAVAEQQNEQLRDRASHRYLNLEERRSPEGAAVARRQIEIWNDYATGNRVHRLFDETHRLIAGTWEKGDGARVVFNHGAKVRPQAAPAVPVDVLLSLEDVWQLDPSAKSFESLIVDTNAVHVERRSASYVLTYEKERTIGASRLLKATLTLNQSDLRPIEQTLLVQRGGELREYRFVEAGFELVPAKAVDKKVFDVEPELTGGNRSSGKSGDLAHRDSVDRVPPSMSTSAPAASAELEVDVAYLLNQAKADRNEQVALTRSAGGSLRVEGIVDGQQRKNELLRALAPVSQNPAVVIDIKTVDEALQRTSAPGRQISIDRAEETANTIAADKDLREYFSANANVDELVSSFSSRAVNRAYRALFQAIALERLINRFENVDMRTVTPDARAKWLAMIREHANAFERETAILREELHPIFFASAPSSGVEEFAIDNDADLAVAVERLHKLALANNDAVRAAFTISSRSSVAPLKSSFWRMSASAQSLARKIERYAK